MIIFDKTAEISAYMITKGFVVPVLIGALLSVIAADFARKIDIKYFSRKWNTPILDIATGYLIAISMALIVVFIIILIVALFLSIIDFIGSIV